MGRFRTEGAIEAFKNVYEKGASLQGGGWLRAAAPGSQTQLPATGTAAPACRTRSVLTRRHDTPQAAAHGACNPLRRVLRADLRLTLPAPAALQRFLGWPRRQAV